MAGMASRPAPARPEASTVRRLTPFLRISVMVSSPLDLAARPCSLFSLSSCPRLAAPCRRTEYHQAQDLEQHLGAGMGSVGGGVVLRRDLDHVATDEINALQPTQ